MSNQDSEDSTKIVSRPEVEDVAPVVTHIQFMYGQKIVSVSRPEELPLFFGRDKDNCHLYVPSEVVSRQHCVVDYHQGRIVIRDQSTNGTFVKFGQAEEICLRKTQSYPLNGRGMIKLGKSFSKDDEGIIYFKCR